MRTSGRYGLVAVLVASVLLTGCTGAETAANTPSPSFSYSPGTPSRLATPPTGTPTPVAAGTSKTLAPVPMTSPAKLPGKVTLAVVRTTSGTVTGAGPGVVNGQAQVAFTLKFTNSSSKPFDVDTVEVNAWYGTTKKPASPDSTATKPFHGALAPGSSATAVYAFAIPSTARDHVGLSAWYQQGGPTVVFEGPVG